MSLIIFYLFITFAKLFTIIHYIAKLFAIFMAEIWELFMLHICQKNVIYDVLNVIILNGKSVT